MVRYLIAGARYRPIILFAVSVGLLSTHAQAKIKVDDLLTKAPVVAPYFSNPGVNFKKTNAAAGAIERIVISYYDSANCTGTAYGIAVTSGSFTLVQNAIFTMNRVSIFDLIANTTYPDASDTVSSISVQFQSVNASATDPTKSTFLTTTGKCGETSGNSKFCCVPVDCTLGSSTYCEESGTPTNDFTLPN